MCWEYFHSHDVPDLPPCTEKYMGLARRRALRFDTVLPQARIPVRAVILTRCNSESSPTKAGATSKLIGERLVHRAAGKPNRLTTTNPRGNMTESLLKGMRLLREITIPRREPLLLAVWRPGGPKGGKRKPEVRFRVASAEEGTKATIAMAAVSR